VWSSVLVLAPPMAFDPVRLGMNLLMISWPRPAQNLLVYWVGCVSACVALLLVPVMVVHFTPMFSSFAQDLASPATTASSAVRHVEIFMGLLALSIAALMAVRVVAQHQRAQQPALGAHTSTLVLDSNTPTPSWPREPRSARRSVPSSCSSS
jgi:Sap, sulfolipid-1-addressing protein